MGVGSRNSSNSTFLSIFKGKIVQEWRKEEPKEEYIPAGCELRTRKISKGPNEGKDIWFIEHDYLEGELIKVERKTGGDYGPQLLLHVRDVDEVYILTMGMDTTAAQSFLLKMNNIDLNMEVSFEPWSMSADEWLKHTGKQTKSGKSGMTIKQNGEKIMNFYTKEDPKGMPEINIRKVRGETKVDSVDRDIFLDEKLDEFVAALDKRSAGSAPAKKNYTDAQSPGNDDAGDDEDYDDLPF